MHPLMLPLSSYENTLYDTIALSDWQLWQEKLSSAIIFTNRLQQDSCCCLPNIYRPKTGIHTPTDTTLHIYSGNNWSSHLNQEEYNYDTI